MEQLKKLKDYWLLIAFFIGGISGIFMSLHNVLNKNNELLMTVKTTQQMALKSVIWNEEIPLTERASACDIYLAAGYNSMTKKECETIIDKASEQGVF